MADVYPKEVRSYVMSQIRSKDTKPEKVLRSALHSLGYRFRLHRSDLPGKPDLVFPKYNSIVFIHGCFWHFHQNCDNGKIPKSNKKYWKPKLLKNVEKGDRDIRELRRGGYNVMVVWECEVIKNLNKTIGTIERFFRRKNKRAN